MKFNSLQELKTKVASQDKPLFDKNSKVPIDKEEIYSEIAEIINFQLNNVSLIPTEFRNLSFNNSNTTTNSDQGNFLCRILSLFLKKHLDNHLCNVACLL